jgi:hypothetical protein
LAVLNERAHEAGVTLTAMLDAETPEQYKKAIDDLNAALQFQDDAMKTLDDTIQKWGIDIDKLGPAMDRQNLDKKAKELFQDWSVLHAAGIDQVEITQKMSAQVSKFVQDSIRMGVDIPAAMKPMLQNFIDMGDLVDENGQKITDISKIPFAETMSQGFDRVVAAVQKLIDAITRGLGTAIDNIPDPNVTGHVSWNVDQVPNPSLPNRNDFPMPPGELPEPAPVPGFAGGTRGQFLNFGAGTLAMLHGRERVMTEGEASGATGVVVNGLSVTVQVAQGDDPKAIADNVLEALRTQAHLYQGFATIADRQITAAA